MTTQDDRSEATETTEVTTTARHASNDDAPADEATPSVGQAKEPATEATGSEGKADQSTDESFFGADALSGFRSHWDEVQFAFVDDPRDSVGKADSLVSEVFDHLTSELASVRAQLDAARNEGASTEDLRLALKRYRAYFRRLLTL